MRFLFHIGTEKTGSSFVQSLCALGREDLVQQGIWFARGWAYDERCMASGQISAGNGRQLAQDLHRRRWDEVRERLNAAVSEAQERRCGTVLFSSEWLLAAFAEQTLLQPFTAILGELGAEEIRFLLVLRDPVEQFLSLYKHRAKRGTAGSVTEWASGGYRLPDELAWFREALRDTGAALVVRKYRREPGALEYLFFEEWLGVQSPGAAVPESVNPSLTLSELELLRKLGGRRPSLVQPLYDRLLALDVREKVQGRELAAYARAVAEHAVAAHRDEWAGWNERLPESERLVIPQPEREIPPEPGELGFSKAQVEALMEFLGDSIEPSFLGRLLWSAQIRPALGSVKRAMMPRKRS